MESRSSEGALDARQPANEVSSPSLQRALDHLGAAAVEGQCGPYVLWTDVQDTDLLAACERVGEELDGVYRARFGLDLLGAPRESLFLFARRQDLRAFAQADGRTIAGYSGYASAPRGFVVVVGDADNPAETLRTLAHEMTHLVHRRGLGSNLPPWLSEGLADAVGDTASPRGLRPLEGVRGSEAQAGRLVAQLRSGGALDLQRLTGISRSGFDASPRAMDYETSALLVRFLLLDDELRPRFHGFLRQVAAGGAGDGEALRQQLAVSSWRALEDRFERWLESTLTGR